TVTCVCGTPFAGDRVDAMKPEEATAYPPTADRDTVNLLDGMERVAVPAAGGRTAVGYRCSFEAKAAGDYLLSFTFPPLWLADEKRFVTDLVRVVVHVRDESGWAKSPPGPFAIVPMTRPYGLGEHTVFLVRLVHQKPVRRQMVEVERYSPAPPAKLPDPEFVTARVLTDDAGVATCTLHERGWWVLSAEQSPMPMTIEPTLARGEERFPVRPRAVFVVFVAGRPGAEGQK
ncbi:MAG TPA: DUF4198 domain-containing protein, partial [Humisphaera sp.]